MKTVRKVEDHLLPNFNYDQAVRMLLSTFIAGLSGNPGRQVRFEMLATVDEALQIAITGFEAEAQEKRNLISPPRILKPTEKVEATLVSSGRPLEDQITERLIVLVQTRLM